MTQKLTEEQQRAAHKIIVANRGDCGASPNLFLSCDDCPNNITGKICFVTEFKGCVKSPEFQAENLRRSQAWLDAHITDAEIMAETPKEFCERMVRTKGFGRCKGRSFFSDADSCKNCVLFTNTNCSENLSLNRAKAYLASHPATPQEPPKRRPTPEEMVVGATVRVRLWDEMVRDGKLSARGHIQFPTIYFNKEMRQYCGTTHKVIKCGGYARLAGCGDWTFIPEMLDYVEPEKVAEPKKNDAEWHFINFMDLLPADAQKIVSLEAQVKDLTKKLDASTRRCDRLQRRLRANWEAKRDSEIASREEIAVWWNAGKGSAILRDGKSTIRPKGRTDWIPATRGNLKL